MNQKRLTLTLTSIIAIAVILRLVWLIALWDAPFRADEAEYVHLAQSLWQGVYTDNGRWLRPPLYPLWLALTSGGGASLLFARLAQVALGTLLVYLCYRVALQMWQDRRSALLSALLAALSFPLIGYANYLMAETLLLVLLCFMLLALLHLIPSPTLRWAMVTGGIFGLAMLTKPIALACLPALLVAHGMSNTTWRRRVLLAMVTLLSATVVVAPWTIRNALVYQRFIPIDTTSGFNLWLGNLPPAEQPTINAVQREMQARYPNIADRNAAYQHMAYATLRQAPLTTLAVLGNKARQLWQLETDALVRQQYIDLTLECPRSLDQPKAIITGAAFGTTQPMCWWRMLSMTSDVVFLVMLLGVLIALVWQPRSPQMVLVWVWVLGLASATTLTVVQTRLRLPMLPVLIPVAAAGFVKLFTSYQRQIIQQTQVLSFVNHQRWRVGATLAALALGIWAMRLLPLAMSQGYGMAGAYAWRQGTPQQAWHHYQAAVAWYPERTDLLVQAGQVAETLGNDEAAYFLYKQAINVVYYQAQARIGAARVLLRQGDSTAATTWIDGTVLSQGQVERISFATPYLPSRPTIDLGGHAIADYGYVLGFYPASPLPATPTFRWSQERAGIRFGTLPTPETIVGMRLSTSRPVDAPIPRVGIFVNSTYLTHINVEPGWWRTYRFVVPPTPQGIRLTLHTDTIPAHALSNTDQSGRELGIAVDWAVQYGIAK